MIKLAKGVQRKILDYKLTRYACYLIVQNGDSRKKAIALGQTYFAIQRRKQELSEKEYSELTEDKITNDKIQGEKNANDIHLIIGKIIREVIKKNGGTMPEDLPTPNKSLKELETDKKLLD